MCERVNKASNESAQLTAVLDVDLSSADNGSTNSEPVRTAQTRQNFTLTTCIDAADGR